MKIKHRALGFYLLTGMAMAAFTPWAVGQGSAVTYQGRLTENGQPANGHFDLQFILFATEQSAQPVGPILTNPAVAVNGGLFTTMLDFDAGLFTGTNYWLEIGVRTNGSAGPFTTLVPRQPISPTPYALYSSSAGTAGTIIGTLPPFSLAGTYSGAVELNNPTNSFSGNGGGLKNVNAATIGGFTANQFWMTAGNSGVSPGPNFLGTTDNQPLEFKVDAVRALRLELNGADAPNVIGGAPLNGVAPGVVGATIGGGGGTNIFFGLMTNYVSADFATIGGGQGGLVGPGAESSTIGGGLFNAISHSTRSTIGGGAYNLILADSTGNGGSTIAGGKNNIVQTNASFSTVGGGFSNTIETDASSSAIGGGGDNTIQIKASFSTIDGGQGNVIQTNASLSAIGGGLGNMIQSDAFWSTIGGGGLNAVLTGASRSTVGGGDRNVIEDSAAWSTIGGGANNTIQKNAEHSTISGGGVNLIGNVSFDSTIGGGYGNAINEDSSLGTIAGGYSNVVAGIFGSIPGGDRNMAGIGSFAAGHRAKAVDPGTFVWADSTEADFKSTAANQFLIRAEFTGINRATQITPNEYLGVRAPVTNDYGGMYVETAGVGLPFYGYAMQGKISAYHFVDGKDGDKWKLNLKGKDLLVLNPNGNAALSGTLSQGSDRAHKENFQAIDPSSVLAQLVKLPISQWNYISEPGVSHVGPMAQDFRSAFGLGADDKHITTIDSEGVALAAIQGLNQKLEEQATQLRKKDAEIRELRSAVSELKNLLTRPKP